MPDILFADVETSIHDGADLPRHGHVNYALDPATEIRVWGFALDDGPVITWEPGDPWPQVIWDHVESGGKIVCWNAQFDRWIWQQIGPEVGMPDAALEQFLDAMGQACVSGLPSRLDQAGEPLGLGRKLNDGKTVMLECGRMGRKKSPKSQWEKYLSYVKRDVDLMRKIWQRTMPLALEDWEDYWVSEIINDRGMPMDMKLAKGAASYFEEEKADVTAQVQSLTRGEVKSQWCSGALNQWVWDRIPKEARRMMRMKDVTKTRQARQKDPDAKTIYKKTLGRERLVRLRDWLAARQGASNDVVKLLTVLEWGRSSSAAKFQKIVDRSDNGKLYGAYTFCGAGQTGRFSSRDVQLHNTPRARIGSEILDNADIPKADRYDIMVQEERSALRDIRNQVPIRELDQYGPISRTLSRAVRPSIRGKKGYSIVWADYSAIEARVLPWLAVRAGIEDAQDTLDAFEQGEDLYVKDAAAIFDIAPEEVTDFQRQAGKVARLALGFRGGKGAYLVMASSYGLVVSDQEADDIVKGWRQANLWSADYAEYVWESVCQAIENPGEIFTVGDCRYWFDENLMTGTLIAQLPSGRCLCYPRAKLVMEEHEELGFETLNVLYGHGREKSRGWVGTFIENLVQATANDILRHALKRLIRHWHNPYVCGHTHDDIICNVPSELLNVAKVGLVRSMVEEPAEWMKGLPLKAEAESDKYYHK